MANISKAERERRAAAAQEAQMADIQDNAGEQAADEIKYIKMTRNPEVFDAPHEAQVHPKEVTNYARGGWELVSE